MVVATHRDHLMAGCEVLEDEQVRDEIGKSSSNNDIAEDRQNLVSVKHPFLFLQSVLLVELLYFSCDALRDSYDNLHFADRRSCFLQLPELLRAVLVRLRLVGHHIFEFNTLNYAVLTFVQTADVSLDGLAVEAKPVLYHELLRRSGFEVLQDESKFNLASLVVVAYDFEGLLIEDWFLEEDGSAGTKNVLFVCNK